MDRALPALLALFAAVVVFMPREAPCQGAEDACRSWYLQGEAEQDKTRKKDCLDRAVDAADRALAAEPANVHATYWRAMALLLKSDMTGGISALRMVKDAMRGLEAVAAREPAYDSAGAYRSLGKVLIEAPAWSLIGNKKKGLAMLLKAKETAPDSLVNRLYLAQAYIKNGRDAEARAELEHITRAPLGKDARDDLATKEEARKLLGAP